MAHGYLPYDIDQRLLLPPDMRAWLPQGHLALFILDVVGELDLSPIYAVYDAKDERGRAGYHPAMMVALLIYGYCTGRPSSRRIERATHEDVAFRVIAGDRHPDHDCIAALRKLHLDALAGLFMQVLQLCQKAGLVKLGHIAIDGTKIKANASKHKAMSYERMGEAEKKLQDEVQRLLAEAERIDAEEDGQHGKGRRGDEAQIIVAADVVQAPNDVRQLVPMAEAIVANVGALAETTSADAGYFSKENVEHPALATTNLLVPPSRLKHGQAPSPGSDNPAASPADRMRHKLASDEGRALYKMRKAIVEPVFGQLKAVRSLRQFLMRGLAAARGEFALMALTHNLLKLFRSGVRALAPIAG